MNALKYTLGILLIAVVAVGGWFVYQSQSGGDLANLPDDVTKLSEQQVNEVISRVSRFIVVPEDEQPTVAVLRDTAALAERQPFYRGAKDGDILIIYSSRAIIYDPKVNKLVHVGPITRTDTTPTPSASASPSTSATPVPEPEKVTVDVRNGTTTAGLAGATATELKKNAWVTIGKVSDASGSFTATSIVDLSKGTKPGAVAALQKLLGGTVVTELPKGEASSTADIVVIVGK
jgi:hypothetical protein